MGDKNISTLLAALKLDEQPLVNQLMYVEELNGADGSFILSAIIKQQIERKNKVIFVMCHHSIGHFHSISQKLGYSIMSLKEEGEIHVIDLLDKIAGQNFLLTAEPFKQLYVEIKEQFDLWKSENGICIIVENLGDLLITQAKDCLSFVCYLRALVLKEVNSSFVLSMHTFPDCSHFNYVTKSIRHFADVVILLKDLETGRANDVTGHLTVTRREENFTKITSQYQYQLLDKSISVFTPGSRSFI